MKKTGLLVLLIVSVYAKENDAVKMKGRLASYLANGLAVGKLICV